ncbi:MAG: hypothetical protein PVJ02_17650 [Gemmatimonadota bacterium]
MTRPRPTTHTPIIACLALLLASLAGPSPATAAPRVPTPSDTTAPGPLPGLRWRTIGPAVMGGRISDIAVNEARPSTFWVGTASGGVWRTDDGGTTWQAQFQHQRTASIGDVAVAPSNPNVVWVGTGERSNRQSSAWGAGVFRSLDGGKTWKDVGLTETRHVSRIVIDPQDPDVVYVAAMGHLWGPNEERGVFRTKDGGETWEKVLYVDENTGAIDLVMDARDPQTLFAATYQRQRTAWGYNGGGPGSGIWRTLDGGEHWERLTEGLPSGDKGRIGLDVYRRDGNLVYAIVEARTRAGYGPTEFGGEMVGGIYRSTDRGETWEHLNPLNERPMYFSQIRVDPNDPSRIYDGGRPLYISDDGGRTFRRDGAEGVHSDIHALWIDPSDSDHLLLGTDGGVYMSRDHSRNWRHLNRIPIAQFYEITVGSDDPYTVCGGLQDNGSWCGPSRTYSERGILNAHWRQILGSDGYYTSLDPDDPTVVYAEGEGGEVERIDRETGEGVAIRPVPRQRPGAPADRDDYDVNWNTPVVTSLHDPATLYFGAQVLLRSTDRGRTWEEISPNLTRKIDRDTLPIMGVLGSDIKMARNDGTAAFGTITTIGESPLRDGLLYVGTDDGNVQRTRDGGRSWTDITPSVRGLPDGYWVSRVVPSGAQEGTVYLSVDGHRSDDFRPFVLRSDDYGESWELVVDGLPAWSVNVVTEHPDNPSLLFAGTEVGVWASLDRGDHWFPLDEGMPTVPVDDILVHRRSGDLVAGTHGRGIWILDDASALARLTPDVVAEAAHLFPARPARLVNLHGMMGGAEPSAYAAPNPPEGALLRYWVGAANGEDSVHLELSNASGRTVRTLAGPGTRGLHQVVWDLRWQPADGVGGDPGPAVLPGSYTVHLEGVGVGDVPGVEVQVQADPRIRIARSDLEARQELLMAWYRIAGPVSRAVDRSQGLTQWLREVQARLSADDADDALVQQVRSVRQQVDSVANLLRRQVAQRGAGTARDVRNATAAPTEDQRWVMDQVQQEAPPAVEALNRLLTQVVPPLVDRLQDAGQGPVDLSPVTVPGR